jgi:hypothetical protein
MKVSKKGRRAMAVGAAKSDMKRGMKAQWSDHKGRRGEAVGMAERALIDKWHREKDQDKKARPGPEERAARHGRMAHHRSTDHRDLRDRHHQSLGDRIRESAGAAAYDATRGRRRR